MRGVATGSMLDPIKQAIFSWNVDYIVRVAKLVVLEKEFRAELFTNLWRSFLKSFGRCNL